MSNEYQIMYSLDKLELRKSGALPASNGRCIACHTCFRGIIGKVLCEDCFNLLTNPNNHDIRNKFKEFKKWDENAEKMGE